MALDAECPDEARPAADLIAPDVGTPATRQFTAPPSWSQALNDRQLLALTGHIQHLFSDSPESRDYAPPDEVPPPETLHAIGESLRVGKQIDKLFMAAMCCALPAGSTTGRFGTHILIVALHACREIRLMCHGKRSELLNIVHQAHHNSTAGVLEWVKQQREPPPDESGEASVLSILGLVDGLATTADPRDDLLGLDIDEDRLPRRVRPRGLPRTGS